jgi:hypothetical protein
MMAVLEYPVIENVSKQNARVKYLTPDEKDVIKNVYGHDLEIPQTIYNRIQKNLDNNKSVNAVLKIKTDDGNSYWTVNQFSPSNKNRSKFIVKTELTTKYCIDKTQKLYNVLCKIENHVSDIYADKYLDGYLEEKCITFSDLVAYHS